MVLNYKKIGDEGPEIIILHGLFGMLDNWKTFGRKLGEDYQVYLVDQRDHGKSPRSEVFDYKTLADDLSDFIALHQLSPLAVIGHSMGGKTVMQFSNDYPHLTNRLVVVDIGPLENEPGHEAIFKALFKVEPNTIESRTEAHGTLSKYLKDEGVIQFLMKNLSRRKLGGYEWKMNLPLIHDNYENILAGITFDYMIASPTLFVKGERSDYIDHANVQKIEEVFTNVDIETVSEAGHWVHADQGEKLLELIKSFLED